MYLTCALPGTAEPELQPLQRRMIEIQISWPTELAPLTSPVLHMRQRAHPTVPAKLKSFQKFRLTVRCEAPKTPMSSSTWTQVPICLYLHH